MLNESITVIKKYHRKLNCGIEVLERLDSTRDLISMKRDTNLKRLVPNTADDAAKRSI